MVQQNISVPYSELAKGIQEIQNHASQMNQTSMWVSDVRTHLQQMHRSDSARLYQQKVDQWSEGYQKVKTQFDDIIGKLQNTVNSFRNTDGHNQNLTASFQTTPEYGSSYENALS
ncbi:WXG100 family type VII secretion target [Amycolatopsis sp. NPDC059021]|uniref:WXG100 family type VII secretion target n=1 Tax=Amycolatopsis sp. NPDC059021 TaxID=3346704 RepID=UPI00366C5628